jgi:3-hydroxyisobutyrate dehydrogenase-like beta-hydroxyacid dehydrogenase
MTTIGVVAPGAMGSAVARRLTEHGVRVLTLLAGRSAATRARAEAAGMAGTDPAGLMAADVILSIVPPGEAAALAAMLAPTLAGATRKPTYVDCNALDVETVKAIGDCVGATGAAFIDAGIIGLPPKPGQAGPKFYLAGVRAAMVGSLLADAGVRVKVMSGPVGAASALKMSYAGITKGLSALASMMILGAERAGAGDALRAELADSQAQLLARFSTSLPDMVPKAYRWVAEMREISAFLNDDPAGAAAFGAIADFYARIAADAAGERGEVAVIEAFARQP